MKKRIEHIVKYESKVKSFVKGTFDEKRILQDAAKIHAKTSNEYPLKGLLFGVKDIINVDGYPTRCGSLLPHELFTPLPPINFHSLLLKAHTVALPAGVPPAPIKNISL